MQNFPAIIERIAIVVDDLSSTIDFYKTYLGFTLEKQYCNQELGIKAAVLVRKSSRIELFEYSNDDDFAPLKPERKRKIKRASREIGIQKIIFRAGNLQKTKVKLKPTGAQKKVSPKIFQDPNGYILEEISEKKSVKNKSDKNRN